MITAEYFDTSEYCESRVTEFTCLYASGYGKCVILLFPIGQKRDMKLKAHTSNLYVGKDSKIKARINLALFSNSIFMLDFSHTKHESFVGAVREVIKERLNNNIGLYEMVNKDSTHGNTLLPTSDRNPTRCT